MILPAYPLKVGKWLQQALNASSVKLGSRIAALRRKRFMALSTSELVTDTLSESSERGQSGIAPVSILALEAVIKLLYISLYHDKCLLFMLELY